MSWSPVPAFDTTAALSTAYAVNAPVLALTGQIQQSMIGRNVGLLHELPDQLAIMRGLTKWADRIPSPAAAPGLVNEAFRRLLSGRQRPVALECALDTWARRAPVELIATPRQGRSLPGRRRGRRTGSQAPGQRRTADDHRRRWRTGRRRVRRADRRDARRAGHDRSHGPGRDRWPASASITAPAGYRFWGEADVVLAVGTRLQPQQQNWGLDDTLKIIRVDVDSEELDRQRKPEIGIVGDATATIACAGRSARPGTTGSATAGPTTSPKRRHRPTSWCGRAGASGGLPRSPAQGAAGGRYPGR